MQIPDRDEDVSPLADGVALRVPTQGGGQYIIP